MRADGGRESRRRGRKRGEGGTRQAETRAFLFSLFLVLFSKNKIATVDGVRQDAPFSLPLSSSFLVFFVVPVPIFGDIPPS